MRSVRKANQILLQRIDTERVLDLEQFELAIGTVGLDQKRPILPEKAGSLPKVGERHIRKVAQHGFISGVVHCLVVLGAAL